MNWGDVLDIDTDGGSLKWRTRADRTPQWNALYAGKEAGCRHKRKGGVPTFIGLRFNREMYQAHHIIWEVANGPVPVGLVVDHIDGNPYNNRLANLRVCTHAENCRNRPRGTNNRSGIKGVFWNTEVRKWRACITVDRKNINLGFHPTKGLAAVAYAKGSLRYHGTFARPV